MASSQTIVILGAGQQSKVIISMARSLGLSIEGVFDDRRELWGTELLGEKVLGPIDLATDTSADGAVVAIGDNVSRREVVARMNLPWLTLVHPTAWVDPSSSLGEGSVVLPQAGVSTDAAIGRHAILNLRSLVSHDCRLGDFVHVAPGAILAGEAQVGSGTLIGAGAIVAPRVRVGSDALVGIGTAIARPVSDGTKVIGVPPKPLPK